MSGLLLSGFAGTRVGGAFALLLAAMPLCAQQTQNFEQVQARAFVSVRQARGAGGNRSAAEALGKARARHAAMMRDVLRAQGVRAEGTTSLTAAWTAMGPKTVMSAAYGAVSGRVTAVVVDKNDTSGNTVYVGTTGGGVWKSTNVAGAAAQVSFVPLTDTLPVFSNNVAASLSIGAMAMQPAVNPVLLAGTGDPNDATDSYYGEGVLRSVDGGLTWTLVSQSSDGANGHTTFTGLGTAGIAFSTATPSLVVMALTTAAEGALVNAVPSTSAPGIYYSTDAGVTWQMASVFDGSAAVQQPQSGTHLSAPASAVVWDAMRGAFYAAIVGHGYYSSADGVTWQRMEHQPGAGLTVGNCPTAYMGANCPIFRGALAVQAVTGDLYALTVDANNVDQGLWQDVCGAVSGACANGAPVFANKIDAGALDTTGTTVLAQGDYDLTLAASAVSGGTNLYVGTVDLYRCVMTAGSSSCVLRNTTNALNGCAAPAKVAAAQHALAVVGGLSAPLVFVGNDGGLWRSTDGVAETGSTCDASDAGHFDDLNTGLGSLSEVIGFAQDPVDADTLLVGLGADGSAVTTAASAMGSWTQMSTGQGGVPWIDPNDSANWWLSIGAGVNLKWCAQGASCGVADFVPQATVGAAQTAYDAALIAAPTLLDPQATTEVMAGTCRVWRGAANGVGWSSANAISGAFDGALNGTAPSECSVSEPLIRSLAAGGPLSTAASGPLAGSRVVYVGMAGVVDGGEGVGGAVFVTKTADVAWSAGSWVDVATSTVTNDTVNAGVFNPGGFDISSLAVDAHDPTGATVYATVMGFAAGASASPHVYRSTNFGASWVNVTANLPDAPANAVLVDPNDANTMYVAMDTGVYVTTAVTTCAVSNCWSPLGTGLPNSPVVAMEAAPMMLTGDGRRGMLRVATYGRGIWSMPLVKAVSIAQPAVTVMPSALSFGSQQVATESAAQSVTVTSSGNAPVVFGQAMVSTGFVVTADTCSGQTIVPGATCGVSLVFAPTATGAASGSLVLFANVSGGQASVALAGTGTAAANITLNPVSVTFAETVVGQTSAVANITVNNTGGTTATLNAPVLQQVAKDFAIVQNTCVASLAPSTGCTISVSFTPTASGSRTGTLSITDTSTGVTATQTASLTGVGDAPATDTLSTNALSFPQTQVGMSSTAQSVTVTNSGSVVLSLSAPGVSSNEFTVTNHCGLSLPGQTTCAYAVVFVPATTGTRTATLTITDSVRSQSVTLVGVGLAPPGVSMSPMVIAFPATGVGLASTAQVVTLTNNGGVPLVLSGAPVMSAGFAMAQNGCATTIAVNASCAMQVVFAPKSAGAVSGTLTLSDNAPSGVQVVSLSGTGVDFSLSANGMTTQTVKSGVSASYSLLLSSLPSLSGNVALACVGAPKNTTCVVAPATPVLGGTTNVVVTLQTGVQASLHAPMLPWMRGTEVVVAMMVPVMFLRRKRIAFVVMLLAVGAMSGCGAGREIPLSGGTSVSYPTPSGTYDITVTGTAAGVSHSVGLTLVVE